MIPGFQAIVEERIKKAQKKGEFDNLPGKGKPLPVEAANVPEELRMAHKILKNAGFLPPQVEVKKQITQTRELLDSIEAPGPEKTRVQKRLNYLLTKLDTLKGDSCTAALARDQYRNAMIKKLS
jgi:excinuclease UvrABC helicase subunit UvrB